jgi:hypothetical protein
MVSPCAAQELGSSSSQAQPIRTHWAGSPGLREIPRSSLERVARTLHDDAADDTLLEGLLIGAGVGGLVAGAFMVVVAPVSDWGAVLGGAAIGAGAGAMIGLLIDAGL